LTQTDLTRALAKAFGLPHVRSQRILRALLENITQALATKKTVALRGFGSFHPVRRAAKKVRHPTTGEIITLPEHMTLRFRPARSLEKRLNTSRSKGKRWDNR
jgi:DNA-binding protein HU-beta